MDMHPDYKAVKEGRRWASNGKLPALWSTLNQAARARERRWHWRIMPNGLAVALRHSERRYDLRIARKSTLHCPDTDEAWQADVNAVLDGLTIRMGDGVVPAPYPTALWHRHGSHVYGSKIRQDAETVRRVLIVSSLLWGEVTPLKALCWQCNLDGQSTVVPWEPDVGVTGQLCNMHAHGRVAV